MKIPCSPRLAMALAGLALGAVPTPIPAHAAVTPDDTTTRAQAADDRARRAARAKRYRAAIDHYEDALRLEPTAKRFFNLGVCHHRLMMKHAPQSPAYETHRGAAVDAYNRYLQATPDADDAQAVKEMIRAMGGTPLSAQAPEPWTIDLVEPDQVPDPPHFENEASHDGRPTPDLPSEPTPPAADPGPLRQPRWGVGVFLPLSFINPVQAAASDELRPAPNLGLGLSGHAYLGRRRRLHLGGEMVLAAQMISAQRRHRFSVAYITLVIEGRHTFGGGRWEVGGGGSIGPGSQALVFTGEPRWPCSVDEREASRRGGLWATGRLYLAALLGKRRNHAITLRLGPGIGVFSRPSVASTEVADPDNPDAEPLRCREQPHAFAAFGVSEQAALIFTLDLGYSPRF
ncbi:MAG: hypothetical protein AAGF11_19175 [Myxococcota bacterium]